MSAPLFVLTKEAANHGHAYTVRGPDDYLPGGSGFCYFQVTAMSHAIAA